MTRKPRSHGKYIGRGLFAFIFKSRGLPNTPKLNPMDESHEQPDTPEVSSRET